jgi:hypothetical protein
VKISFDWEENYVSGICTHAKYASALALWFRSLLNALVSFHSKQESVTEFSEDRNIVSAKPVSPSEGSVEENTCLLGMLQPEFACKKQMDTGVD